MMRILTNLAPRHCNAGHILFEENDEVNEIIFVSKGEVDVGYTINGQTTYALRFINKIMVAAYNATYNFRTVATYKCHTDIYGYSIK